MAFLGSPALLVLPGCKAAPPTSPSTFMLAWGLLACFRCLLCWVSVQGIAFSLGVNCSLSIYMHCFSFTSLRPSHFSSKSMTCTDGLLSLLPAIGRFLFSNTCIRIYSLLLPPLCPSAFHLRCLLSSLRVSLAPSLPFDSHFPFPSLIYYPRYHQP